jgi:hypothetical protein
MTAVLGSSGREQLLLACSLGLQVLLAGLTARYHPAVRVAVKAQASRQRHCQEPSVHVGKWGLAQVACLGLLIACAAPAVATESLTYAPVQTEREVKFLNLDLGLKADLAALENKLGHAPALDYALIDLDGDGEPELFIRIHQDESCDSGRCSVLVFSKSQDAWARVLEAATADVSVAKRTTKGYRDLLVDAQPWTWTGKRYGVAR